MTRREGVVEKLERCVARESNWLWHGEGALGALGPGVDHRLVERAMRAVFPYAIAWPCRRLPAEYEPLAWRVIAKTKSPEATFFSSLGELRAGAAWFTTARMVDRSKRNRQRLAGLCANAACLEAARAAVAKHGVDAEQLVSVLAWDGSDDSVDVLLDTVQQALRSKDERLDALEAWLVPFARGEGMARVVAALEGASAERGAASPLLALLGRFGAKGDRLSLDLQVDARQVRWGFTRKASAWVVLESHKKPSAKVALTWNLLNSISTRWEDGRVTRDELELEGPSSVDDVPRWIAAAAKRLRVTWDPATVRVAGSLRGKARARAVEWMMGG